MKNIIIAVILIFTIYGLTCDSRVKIPKTNSNNMNNNPINIYDIKVKDTDGKDISLSDYKGKVLLIVNVASKCGYTLQYEGLEKIYEKYKSRGFEILAFPCNDFGSQEPGSNEEIKQFCTTKYNVSFKLFDKVKVLGDEKCELYSKLIKYEPEGDISWNFEKFLIDNNGNVIGRFKSKITPEDEIITSLIEKETGN